MENSKKKDRIKDIAIIFLIVMLLLTLFSNTIMNRSLVEVSTARIESSTLVSKVRGSGYVEAAEAYSVSIDEVRVIATVEVREGQTVSTGDVLFTLKDEESKEITEKRNEIAGLERAYAKNNFDSILTLEQRKAVEAGKGTSLSVMQANLQNAKNAQDAAQAEVDKLKSGLSEYSYVDYEAVAEAEKKCAEAEEAARPYIEDRDLKESVKKVAKDAYDVAYGAIPQDEAVLASAKKQYEDANAAYLEAKYLAIPYETEVSRLQKEKLAVYDGVTVKPENNAEYKKAVQALSDTTSAYDNMKKQYTAEIDLADEYSKIKEEKSKLAEMEKKSVGATIKSPINGTVATIELSAGHKTTAEETMMTIQPENMGYTLSFQTTAVQAKKIKVNDEAKVVNNWWGDDINARVKQIKKDASNRDSVTVVCELSGEDVRVGSNYTLSIGEKSANYDLVVPTNSIREDANGRYILWIESKSTPLGNRYYARRANVEVIASDDTNSAIAAQVEAYEYVITTTSKPVEENQQVRLAD